jgi:hypothetical protein
VYANANGNYLNGGRGHGCWCHSISVANNKAMIDTRMPGETADDVEEYMQVLISDSDVLRVEMLVDS